MHNETNSSEERTTIAYALTAFKQPELIQRALDLITTDTVRLQDIMYWVAYSFMNRFGRDMTWEWLKSHWEWMGKSLGTDLAFYRMPLYSARVFSDASFLPEFKAFFESVSVPALERSIKQGVEMIEWQSEWKQRDLKTLQEFFDKNQ
jgi:aminopeptidase N